MDSRVRGNDTASLNLPDVVAEMRTVFERYEDALVNNKVDVLDELFLDSPTTVRYGIHENLVGYAAIKAFRAGRSPLNLARTLSNTVITTYGRDFATAMTEFRRVGGNRTGRQSQTWWRTGSGWRCVAAHVSLLDASLLDANLHQAPPTMAATKSTEGEKQ